MTSLAGSKLFAESPLIIVTIPATQAATGKMLVYDRRSDFVMQPRFYAMALIA
jgi:hypothetical protein